MTEQQKARIVVVSPRDICDAGDRYRNCQRKGRYRVTGVRMAGIYCAQHAKIHGGHEAFRIAQESQR